MSYYESKVEEQIKLLEEAREEYGWKASSLWRERFSAYLKGHEKEWLCVDDALLLEAIDHADEVYP